MFLRSFSHARAEPRCSVPAEWWRYYPATKRTAHMTSSLWQPFTLGNVELPHRLALAPLTRSRANPDGTPGELAAEYYGQRASLGLIITEGTQPSEDGQGYLNTPGIYTPEHIEGWRRIADTVHAGGGALFIQLMHVGRMSHPDNTPHHRQPVGPSAISAEQDMFTPTGPQKTPVPRELTAEDIQATIAGFRHAAASAIAAGADGVEIHSANGYRSTSSSRPTRITARTNTADPWRT